MGCGLSCFATVSLIRLMASVDLDHCNRDSKDDGTFSIMPGTTGTKPMGLQMQDTWEKTIATGSEKQKETECSRWCRSKIN